MPDSEKHTQAIAKYDPNVEKAWEEFTDRGAVEDIPVRSIIQKSWLKSQELGINPKSERAPTVITPDEIQEKIRKDVLCQASIPALNQLSDTLIDTQHTIVLADDKGRIIYSVGHKQVQDELEKINFRPGGEWSEDQVGPNGIGTPLSLRRPEVVMGYEHYCQGWHPWVCYGAPIYDASHSVIKGAVDITGPIKNISNEAMALAISVAQSIHTRLSLQQYHLREIIREISKDLFQKWRSDGVLIVDEQGFVVEYNSKVIDLMGLDPTQFLISRLDQLIPSIKDTLNQALKTQKASEITLHIDEQSSPLLSVKFTIEPIFKGDFFYGCALVFSDVQSPAVINNNTRPTAQALPQSKYSLQHIIGESKEIKAAVHLVKAAAADPLESNVLLIGETGTGKELIAHSIHSESLRSNASFIAINCAAIPRELMESELFGYATGAFTGAKRGGQKGKFEAANNGTLFLDEINSMSLDLQSKFLRVLDSMEITRVGSSETIPISVRIIAAASESIEREVENKTFRLDLFHRLSVLEIPVPPLSCRGSDVIILANEFLRIKCQSSNREVLALSKDVEKLLQNYHWPGNVRELHNLCVRWVLTVTGNVIEVHDLPAKLLHEAKQINDYIPQESLRSVSDELIKQTLKKTGNNISKAARILGIDRTTIYRRRERW